MNAVWLLFLSGKKLGVTAVHHRYAIQTESATLVLVVNGLDGRVVMQRPAKPCTPVRFRVQPPFTLKRSKSPGGEIGRRKGLKIPR